MGRVHRAMTLETLYSGRPVGEAVAHGRQAVSLLERTEDRFWLTQALFGLSYACYYAGDFNSVLEVAGRLDAVGEATDSRRARANAATMAGLSHAARGEWEAALKACERARSLSPDAFETSFVLASLGNAHAERGDLTSAVSCLEQAVQIGDQVRSRQWREWFRTMLGEAYFLNGQLDQAREAATQALQVCTSVGYTLGVGWSHQVLGRVAHAQARLEQAAHHLDAALQCFASVDAKYEMGRSRLFAASLARTRAEREVAVSHLEEGRALFAALRAAAYVERSDKLARELAAQ
jgi:tetratricopeptide (TPR) repeat protein